jgi:hypothetical protein
MLFGAGFVIWMLPHFRHTPPPMFYLMPPMCLFCCVMLLSEGSPSRLEIDTVGGTYRYSDYRRIGPNAKWGRTVLRWPFVYEHREGIVAEDFQGVGMRYPRGQNEFFYLRLPWKDENSGPITLAVVRSEAEARTMMHDLTAQLGIPQLGRLS